MPELPEVETVVRGLRAPLIGRTFLDTWVDNPKVIQTSDAATFAARIQGQTVRAINRRAKYILCQLDHDLLAVHLKMTGRLYVSPLLAAQPDGESSPMQPDRWVRLRLRLDNGHYLYFSDARRFGRVYLAGSLDEFAPKLGPEPLEDDFTVAVLRERLRRHHKAIKGLLLDQAFVAGVGNIYADEALHRAGIHPLRPADSLTADEITRLHDAIRAALSAGIDYEGASVSWYRKPDGTAGESQEHFYVYGREQQPCLTCGQPIHKIRVAQRGTHFCPHCQPER
jgi:formamidopyrimidine-DNA glycosylase